MKIIILVVMMFVYDDDGGYISPTRHEFVQDSMAACQIAKEDTLEAYYAHKRTNKTGIMILCRYKTEASDD